MVCIFGIIPAASLGKDVLNFSGGSDFCWFFMLYLIGGYLRRFSDKLKYKNYWNLVMFFALAALNILFKLVVENITSVIFGEPKYGDLLLFNSSPIILGEAIFLFLFFSRINIKEASAGCKLIRFISPLVFAVYIIHVHPMIFWNTEVVGKFAPLADLNPLLTMAAVGGCALAVYIACIALDAIRLSLFRLIKVKNICDKLDEKISGGIRRFLKIG